MTKTEAGLRITSTGIVPVIRAFTAQKALMAVDALYKGGISVAEITLTVPGAEKVIESLRKNFGAELLVGAGTVVDVDGAHRCLDAGAQFIISPGFDPATVEFVKSQKTIMIAAALTPTEIMAAWKSGADLIKVFPCSAVGGPTYIKSLKGPFPDIPLLPTGGVNLQTAADFIRAGSAALGIGSELVSASALDSGKPHVITQLAMQFLEVVREARGLKSTASAAIGG